MKLQTLMSNLAVIAVPTLLLSSPIVAPSNQTRNALQVEMQQMPNSDYGYFPQNNYGTQPQVYVNYQDTPANYQQNYGNYPQQDYSYSTPPQQTTGYSSQSSFYGQNQNYSSQPNYTNGASNPSNQNNQRASNYGVSSWRTSNQPNQANAQAGYYGMATPRGQIEQTLTIIKPDAVGTNRIGDIISRFEKSGLRIVAIKMDQLSKDDVQKFYQAHKDRPFYNQLVDFMSSGPVIAIVLQGDNAISKARQIMGATDRARAEPGTIRADYAESVLRNAVHGSDNPDAAKEEIDYFFDTDEIYTMPGNTK